MQEFRRRDAARLEMQFAGDIHAGGDYLQGNIAGHRRTMLSLYVSACLVAGAFTLLSVTFGLVWTGPALIALALFQAAVMAAILAHLLRQRAALQRSKEQKAPLTKQEVDRIKVILVLGLFTIIFWAGFEQAGGLMNLYAQEYTNRMIGSFEVPTAWFQSLNPFFIITLAPIAGSRPIRTSVMGISTPISAASSRFKFIAAVITTPSDQLP